MAAELTTHLELTSATLLELVAAFGSPHHVTAEAEHARELMQKVGGAQLSADKIEQVISSAQNSIGVACLESERAFLPHFGGLDNPMTELLLVQLTA